MDRLGFFKQGLSSLIEAAQSLIGLKHATDSFTEAVDEALSEIKGEMGLHLPSIDADIYNQPENTLAELARMGYTALEVGLYYGGKVHGMSAAAFKSLADKAGLKIVSAHLNHPYEVPPKGPEEGLGAKEDQGAKESKGSEESQEAKEELKSEERLGLEEELKVEGAKADGHVGVSHDAEPKGTDVATQASPDPNDEWWRRALDTHQKLGCRYVVASRLPDYPTVEDVATYVTYFNRIGALAAERGIQFCYHPDATALRTPPRIDGVVNAKPAEAEQKTIFEIITEGCDPELVGLQIDTFETTEAGIDPLKLFEQFGKRITLLHLHDYGSVGDSGQIDFNKIIEKGIHAGVKEAFVEVRNYSLPPINCVERSINNLSALPSVRY